MEVLIALFVFNFIGFLIIHFKLINERKRENTVGVLRIVHTGEEAPSIFLELHKAPELLENSKEVILTITHEKPLL